MARMKIGNMALVGGGLAAAWYFLRGRGRAPAEAYPGQRADVQRAEVERGLEEGVAAGTAIDLTEPGGLMRGILAMSVEEAQQVVDVPITNLTWTRIQRRYPDATLLNTEQVRVLKEKGVVPAKYKLVVSSPSLGKPDLPAFGIIAAIPEQLVTATTASLAGFGLGALYAIHGGSGVTGLGY